MRGFRPNGRTAVPLLLKHAGERTIITLLAIKKVINSSTSSPDIGAARIGYKGRGKAMSPLTFEAWSLQTDAAAAP